MDDKFGFSEMLAATGSSLAGSELFSWDSAETVGVTIVSAIGAYLVRAALAWVKKRFGK